MGDNSLAHGNGNSAQQKDGGRPRGDIRWCLTGTSPVPVSLTLFGVSAAACPVPLRSRPACKRGTPSFQLDKLGNLHEILALGCGRSAGPGCPSPSPTHIWRLRKPHDGFGRGIRHRTRSGIALWTTMQTASSWRQCPSVVASHLHDLSEMPGFIVIGTSDWPPPAAHPCEAVWRRLALNSQ